AEDLTMRFKLENLGCLKDVDIELGDLTIICGKNNTGKTYINYAIYGFLSTWDSIIDFNMEKYNYTEDDILDKNKVKVYISDQNTLTPATITDLGIEVGSFDQEIIEMNNFFNEATVNYDY
ncbi:AAA family ATPase, partial [Planktothrix sp.]